MKIRAGVLRCLAYSCWTIWIFMVLVLVFDKSDRFLNRTFWVGLPIICLAIPAGFVALRFAHDAEKESTSPTASASDLRTAPSKTPLPRASIR